MALSPDGSRVVAVVLGADGVPRLHARVLDPSSALAGTEGAYTPFFSPDGKWMGFAAGGKLKRIPAGGGAVESICDAPDVRGASWGDNGEIVFAQEGSGGLWRVPSSGGTPTAVTAPEPREGVHRWPHVLPGSEAVLFTSHPSGSDLDEGRIEAVQLKTGQRKVLHRGGIAPRFVTVPDGSGRLLYTSDGTVFAARFSAAALEISGEPIPTVQGIHSSATIGAGFEVSPAGAAVAVADRPDAPASADGEAGQPKRLISLLNFGDYLQGLARR
jgi:serine/threonine-protein kinase